LNICVIGTRGFPGVQGGVEKHCENLYPRLPAEVRTVVCRRRAYVQASPPLPGIEFVDLPSTRIKGWEAAFHSFLATLAAIRRRPDLVHVHNIGPGIFSPLVRLAGIPVVLTFHSPNYEHQKWGWLARRLLKLSEYVALRAANAVVFVNPVQMQKYDGAVRRKSQFIPNGVQAAEPDEATDWLGRFGLEADKYILAVGRITPEKGFGLLIDAWRRLPSDRPVLVIAGGVDNDDGHLRELKARAGDAPVVFAGHLTEGPLAQLYRHARLFVLSSRNEGFPLVLLEAMAAGCDVLASDLPATRLVDLPPEDYFRSDEPDDLAAKLQQKLSRTKPVRIYDLKAFDWDAIAARTVAVYREVIRTGGPEKSRAGQGADPASTCSSRC